MTPKPDQDSLFLNERISSNLHVFFFFQKDIFNFLIHSMLIDFRLNIYPKSQQNDSNYLQTANYIYYMYNTEPQHDQTNKMACVPSEDSY